MGVSLGVKAGKVSKYSLPAESHKSHLISPSAFVNHDNMWEMLPAGEAH